jgi:ankyrin repeat protein
MQTFLLTITFAILGFTIAQHPLDMLNKDRGASYGAWSTATVQEVEAWLATSPDINAQDNNGSTALMMAMVNNFAANLVPLILEAGPNVNARDDFGNTALMQAIFGEHTEVIKMLLEAGADVNARNDEGYTALGMAAIKSSEVTKLLLEWGADVNALDEYGNTVTMQIIYYSGNVEVAKILIEAGTDVNVRNEGGHTALIGAVETNPEIVTLLLDAGADVNNQGEDGDTALMKAARSLNEDAVRRLLEGGAKVDIQNESGETALISVFLFKSEFESGTTIKVIKTLLLAGADKNIVDERGKRALDYARQARNIDAETLKQLEVLLE